MQMPHWVLQAQKRPREGRRQHLTGGKNARFLRCFIPGLTGTPRNNHLGHSQGIGDKLTPLP